MRALEGSRMESESFSNSYPLLEDTQNVYSFRVLREAHRGIINMRDEAQH